MKTRHIIAIGLLSALAVGILGLAIHTGKAKTKTFQAKADYQTLQYSYPNSTNEYDQMNLVVKTKNYIEFDNPYIGYEIKNQLTYQTYQNQSSIGITIQIGGIETENSEYEGFTQAYVHNFETEIELIDIEIVHISSQFNQNIFALSQNVWITYKVDNVQQAYNMGAVIQNTYENANENIRHNEYKIEDYIELADTIEGLYNLYTDTANYETGYDNGYDVGYDIGYTTGNTDGYNSGYGIGYSDSDAFNHPIALQPLMLNILTMPFTFIAQAFDVTLWQGTAYEFNIANFIKGMIAIATIMFIIKLFTSGFSIIGNYTGNHYQNKLTRQKIKESKSRTDLNNRTNPNTKTKIVKKG